MNNPPTIAGMTREELLNEAEWRRFVIQELAWAREWRQAEADLAVERYINPLRKAADSLSQN